MLQTLLIALPVVVVFLLSTIQQDSAKTARLLYSIIYIQIYVMKKEQIMLELLFMIFLIIYQFS